MDLSNIVNKFSQPYNFKAKSTDQSAEAKESLGSKDNKSGIMGGFTLKNLSADVFGSNKPSSRCN